MLIRDIIAESVTETRTRGVCSANQEEFRTLLFAEIRSQVDTIEKKLSYPTLSNPSETVVEQLASLYELLDGVMANEGVAPYYVYRIQRAEREKRGGYRRKLVIFTKEG